MACSNVSLIYSSSNVALTIRPNLIRNLQQVLPRGSPFDSGDLQKIGVSSALAHHYVKSGWLSRLGRGVFMFPGDTLRQEDCLKFLARQDRGFHVGGKTALAWRGIRHNLPANAPLSLWGQDKADLPRWFHERFRAFYTRRNPFSSRLPKGFALQALPETPDGVLVSTPERALLEMLSEVGIRGGVEESRNIMEGARTLRPDVLATLLKHCERVKATRLCVRWAEELSLPWAAAARKAAGGRIGRGRWIKSMKDGQMLILKP